MELVTVHKGQPPQRIYRCHDRVEALMDAALSVFKRVGIERSRVYEIAVAAGLSPGTFYLYFESKDDLLRVMWRTRAYAFDDLAPRIEQQED